MTLDEARGVLGVPAEATDDEVRRAYTRLVKQHKPDKDPEGFRRVRGAYELLREAKSAEAFLAGLGAPSRPMAPASAAPALAPAPGTADEAVPSAADAPEQDARDRDDAKLAADRAALFTELGTLLRTRRHQVPARLRAHLVAHPTDDLTRMEASRFFTGIGEFETAFALLSEGARVGREPLAFAARLAAWKPSLLDEEMIAALVADPRTAPDACIALVARRRGEEAATLARAALAADARAGISRRAHWMHGVAALIERGGAALAREIHATVQEQTPADVLHEDDPIQTLLVDELVRASPYVDADVLRVVGALVASPVRGSILLDADPLLPDMRADAIAVLRQHAPQLTRLAFPDELEPRRRQQPPSARALLLLGVIVLSALALVSVGAYLDARAHPADHPLLRSDASDTLCRHALVGDRVCALSLHVDYWLGQRDCAQAWSEVRELVRWSDMRPDAHEPARAQYHRVLDVCGEAPTSTPRGDRP